MWGVAPTFGRHDGEMKGHCQVEELREIEGLSVLQWLKQTTKKEGKALYK